MFIYYKVSSGFFKLSFTLFQVDSMEQIELYSIGRFFPFFFDFKMKLPRHIIENECENKSEQNKNIHIEKKKRRKIWALKKIEHRMKNRFNAVLKVNKTCIRTRMEKGTQTKEWEETKTKRTKKNPLALMWVLDMVVAVGLKAKHNMRATPKSMIFSWDENVYNEFNIIHSPNIHCIQNIQYFL